MFNSFKALMNDENLKIKMNRESSDIFTRMKPVEFIEN
jgi:hypothetical protein